MEDLVSKDQFVWHQQLLSTDEIRHLVSHSLQKLVVASVIHHQSLIFESRGSSRLQLHSGIHSIRSAWFSTCTRFQEQRISGFWVVFESQESGFLHTLLDRVHDDASSIEAMALRTCLFRAESNMRRPSLIFCNSQTIVYDIHSLDEDFSDLRKLVEDCKLILCKLI
ncbi:hypothetical protein JCGZ_20216 [Jatropha curcas]|uniref:Uncharacterized protein n=1 Tax=Jatropha curcas TaxID=180498 RepID=A0A067JU25_JATCU|nr:hypothetical protein JCGZ_20216 [Jatropha curcas]